MHCCVVKANNAILNLKTKTVLDINIPRKLRALTKGKTIFQ